MKKVIDEINFNVFCKSKIFGSRNVDDVLKISDTPEEQAEAKNLSNSGIAELSKFHYEGDSLND